MVAADNDAESLLTYEPDGLIGGHAPLKSVAVTYVDVNTLVLKRVLRYLEQMVRDVRIRGALSVRWCHQKSGD